MSILEADASQAPGRQYYAESQKGKRFYILVLVLALLAAALLSLVLGAADIGMQDLLALLSAKAEGYRSAARAHILMDIRLPRLVLALIAGTGLAISGTVMQAVLRNPLASSYTLGVSSGAGFGAALAIGLGMGFWGGKYIVVANAFVFGMASMFLVYGIARIRGAGPGMLILAGIAVNYFFSALIAVIKYMVADHDALAGIVFWLMGGLNLANWENIGILLPLVLAPSLWLILKTPWDLNAMSSGDEVAIGLGVDPERTRIVALVLAALITSGVVAFTGVIGFVCLVGPHMARMMIGSDHRFLLPFSCLTGALILRAADVAARTVIQPTELPVGIVTALLGVPFFLHLLIRSRRYWT
jgi:iron complex transport system permease protein